MYNLKIYERIENYNGWTINIDLILEYIKNGRWKDNIIKLRTAISNGETKKYDELKKLIPAFTISATFNGRRRKEHLESYTGLIHLDYDKVEEVEKLKEIAISLPFTYSAFISPSGNGLKIIVKTDATLETHREAFNNLKKYYDNILGVESDKSVKDVTRLCFVSYDPELYFNSNSKIFTINGIDKNLPDLEEIWELTSNRMSFEEGNRNNFIHFFACNANRFGIEMLEVIHYSLNYSNASFDEHEIETTIKSAYENNVHEFNTFAKSTKTSNSGINKEVIDREEDVTLDSPFIPDEVYEKLPEILKKASSVFKDRERDVFLTSALSVISGGLHNIIGYYDNETVHPNLFSFVVAPPASGKGSMKYAKQLGECYHDNLLHKSQIALKEYKKEKSIYDKKLKKAKLEEIENLIEPQLPKLKVFFIPGDTSSSMLIKHLEDNDGIGCICETEADTVTIALSKEWGGYSDILRKGFHSEPITKSRRKDFEYSEIKEPKFSFVITGTPNQMNGLITSIQDGLFSRFLFYCYHSEPKWRKTYTAEITNNKKDFFENFSALLCDKFSDESKQYFRMTEKQGRELDSRFSNALDTYKLTYNESVSGIIYRLGLMSFKIAMVLTALRSDETELLCSDEDFETAMTLVEKVYIPHSLNMLKKLDKSAPPSTAIEQKLLDWMPKEETFKRSEILEEAINLGVSDRTLTNILSKFLQQKKIEKIKNGLYRII